QDFQNGTNLFIQGDQISEDHIQHVEHILQYCRQHGIQVIGFSPPYSPMIYADLMASGRYAYVSLASARLSSLFRTYYFVYDDFSNPDALNLASDDFYDVWHSDEYGALQMFIAMLRQSPEALGKYSDLRTLEALADGSSNRDNILDLDGVTG